MCDLSNQFKLCSCDGDQLSDKEIGWKLYRRDKNKQVSLVVGAASRCDLSSKEMDLKTFIAQQLNTKNCFDFEYSPQSHDFLQIRIKGQFKWYSFCFVGTNWYDDRSSPLEAWRRQLEDYQKGYYNVDFSSITPSDDHLDPLLKKAKEMLKGYNTTEVIADEVQNQKAKEELLAKKQSTSTQILEELKALKILKESGAITADEFEEKENALWDLL